MGRATLPPGFVFPPGTRSLGINLDALRPATVRTIPPVPEPVILTPPADGKPTKYRNVRTAYDGRTYDSKAEARRAEELDYLLSRGSIILWLPQPTFRLGCPENVYRPDFLVYGHALDLWAEDVKGKRTSKFNRDCRLWKSYAKIPLRIITNGEVVEIITPDLTDKLLE